MQLSVMSVVWNLFGLGVPMLLAVIAIPRLLNSLGSERFGLLSIAWALTAMAGLFDFGVGRAVTLVVSRYRSRLDFGSARLAGDAALRLALYSGLAGALLFGAAILIGAANVLSYAPSLDAEVRGAGYILMLAVPLQASIAALRGICEANQRFRAINLIRVGMGIGNFGGPLLVALFTRDLRVIVASLLAVRVWAWFAYSRANVRTDTDGPALAQPASLFREILHAGGWWTVSTIVNPILVSSDRFFISAELSPSMVPSYTIPAEMILQMLVLATATTTVAFPSLAHLHATDPRAAWKGFLRVLASISGFMALATIACACVLPTLLPWWVGDKLPADSVRVGQVLCLGVWFNSLGNVSSAYVHANGWFRATALSHLAQLVIYVPCLIFCLDEFGIIGAAIAWTGRVGVDAAGLLCMAVRAGELAKKTELGPPVTLEAM